MNKEKQGKNLFEYINERKYFFRRTCFILDDDVFVEMVAIAEETKIIDDKTYSTGCEVLVSNSREIKIEDCPDEYKKYLQKLKTKDSIEEVYEFKGKKEVQKIIEDYPGDELFKFNRLS